MRTKNKVVKYGVTIGIIVIVLGGFFYWQNNGIVVTKMLFENNKIPKVFDGFKIVHLSDLHNKKFGEGQKT